MRLTKRLPLPPTVNHYYFRGRTLTKVARRYRKDLMILMGGEPRFGLDELGMRVTWHWDTRVNRGDYDNRLKPLGDALEHAGIFANDRQIKEAHIYIGHPIHGGAVDVEIWRRRERDV